MIYTTYEDIGPVLAKLYLEKNIEFNRPLNKVYVRRLAGMMRNGLYMTTHQGIAFNDRGELIDGQHRLNAIILADTTIKMAVTRNVEDDALTCIDQGAKRTEKDVASMTGEDECVRAMLPVANKLLYMHGIDSKDQVPQNRVNFIKNNKKIFETAARIVGKSSRHMRATVTANLVAALANGVPEPTIEAFCRIWKSNETSGFEIYNVKAVLNLRDYLRNKEVHATQEFSQRIQGAIHCFEKNVEHLTLKIWYPINDKFNFEIWKVVK